MKKKLLSILLILLLAVPSFAAAADIDYSVKGNIVEILVQGAKDSPVSIVISDSGRKYYIDQGTTDSNGEITFKTSLEKGKKYNCAVNINGEKSIKQISLEDDQTIPEEPNTAYIYIKGYKGVILTKTKVEIQENDTVMSLTKRVLRANGIDYKGSSGYIASIDGQGEKDKGPGSGWMYSVNGEFPDIGADSVDVYDGDYIKWLYTVDLGKDIGNPYEEDNPIGQAYDLLNDKNASEEEVIDAINIIHDAFRDIVSQAKTEKEIKNVVNEADKMYDSLLQVSQRIKTEKLAKEVSGKSIETVKNLGKLLDRTTAEKIEKEIDKVSQQNMGLILYLTSRIEEKAVDKIINDMIDTSLYIEDKLAINKVSANKAKEKRVSILMPEINKEEIQIVLPYKLLEKSKEKNIDKIQLNSHLTSFNITPNILGNKLDKKDLILIVRNGTIAKLEGEVVSQIPKESAVIELEAMLGKDKIRDFEENIEVSIPYKASINDSDAITVFFIKDDGNIEAVGGLYNPENRTVKFITNHFSKYFAKEAKGNFTDTVGHWAEKEISIMAGKGIINGKQNNEFAPNANISRAEFAALISRMLKYKIDDTDNMPFEDVDKEMWYYEPVLATYKNGIINGNNDAKFNPEGNITRQEMAKIISKVLESKLYNEGDTKDLNIFNDKQEVASWAEKEVALVLREGIIKGVQENRFEPNKNATRAQATVMLYRLYQLILK